MNILLGVNNKTLESYITSLKDVSILGVVKNNRTLFDDVVQNNPQVVVLARTLPGKKNMKDVIKKIRNIMPDVRVVYLYGQDDVVRKDFTNFLVGNGIYDFHVGTIDETVVANLIFNTKDTADIVQEEISEEEKEQIVAAIEQENTEKESLRQKIEAEVIAEVQELDEELSVEEIEDKVEEKVTERIVKELEVQIIERVQEVEVEKEVIKIQMETVIETKVMKQQVISVLSLYNIGLKDDFVSNFSHLLSKKTNQNILLIDFEMPPLAALDHHFNIDKYIYLNELHSTNKLTGVSGCLSGLKKGILNAGTFSEYVKKIKGYDNLSILTGLYDIDMFMDYETEDVEAIIAVAKQNFDTIIIALSNNPFNVFTYASIFNSTKVIFATEPTFTNGRADISFINHYVNEHNVPVDRFSVLLWGNMMDSETIGKLYQGYEVLGTINDNSNYLSALYHKKILLKLPDVKKDIDSYMKILTALGYVPKIGIFERFLKLIR